MDPFKSDQSPVATDNEILSRYPLPLARAWERVLIASPRPEFHHQQLLVMAETITYYLGAVALQIYESWVAAGGKADPTLNRSLRSLRRPTFGQWLGWVRSALAAVPAAESPLPELAPAYEKPDTGMVLLGYESLRPIMVVQLKYSGEYGPRTEVSPRLMLELINQYQLRRANYTLGADTSFDVLGAAASMAPGVRAVLGYLRSLAEYPLLGLVRDGSGAVHVLRLMGLDPTESTVELDPEAAPPGTLLLADREELPLMVLDPWLIFGTCPEDGRVQIATFQNESDGEITYRGIECEHAWTVRRDAGVQLPEIEWGGEAPPATIGTLPAEVAAFMPDELGEYERDLYASFEYESGRMEQDRRMVRQQREATAAAAAAASETAALENRRAQTPDELYRELLEERAQSGLTVDELQALDEQRAADERRNNADS